MSFGRKQTTQRKSVNQTKNTVPKQTFLVISCLRPKDIYFILSTLVVQVYSYTFTTFGFLPLLIKGL